ncbi:hypothetical protein Mapa_009423 [Marchantia paleacea]|nr:hypothetical protein Mapa_009423 [Marchantia paleacea]
MDTMRRAYHGKGGGGGGRRLERRNATKHISYDSHSRRPRRSLDSDQSSYDESESSSHSREDWSLDEYRVLGDTSVEEMTNVCRYLGLPGPASLGIGRDAWDAAKWHNSSVASRGDSMISEDDPKDFTFVVSPPTSDAPTSPQGSFRDLHGRGKDVASDQETGDYDGLSRSPSKHKNDADAADVASFIERHRDEPEDQREQDKQSHRFSPLWRNRSASMPAAQSRPMSPHQSSVVLVGTPKASLLGSKIFNYPDPTSHIQRARSQPVMPADMPSGEAREVRGEKSNSGSLSRGLPPSVVAKSQPDQRNSRDISAHPASVATREVPMPRLVDSSSRSSSSSDGSGEFREPPGYARAEKLPEQRASERKQDIVREQAVAAFRPGSLTRPPPISVFNLPPEAFSTHDLLNGLGPPDASVDVFGKRDMQSDSDDERPDDTANDEDFVESPSSRENVVVGRTAESIHTPQDPVIEVRDHTSTVQIAVVSNDGNTGLDASAPGGGVKDTAEDRASELESDGEQKSPGVDVQAEGTTAPSEDIMSINLTQAPVPVEEGVQDLSPVTDDETRAQTPTFPWSKGDLLGAGSFGTVYEAVDSNGSFFAVKEVSLTDNDKNAQQCISQLEQEIELLSRFKHDNIVQYLGTQRADGKLYIFLELVSKGSLASLCKKFKLTHSQIVAYTRQILKGLKYLHDMNIVHRDIKCANILVDVKGTCKLADFGLAKQISALDQLKSCKGSAYWMAPEVIDPKKTYWLPADIWSLGCSVLEMFTGSPPFGDQEWYRVLWKVGHGEAPPIPEELSDDAKDFIQQCLEVNPTRRPTATVLLQHKFVATSITPTNSGQLNPQMVVSSLQTITEERSGDFTKSSGLYRSSLGNSPLSNGHSGH